ncbi:helix-turn-helix domain-containing protein [Flavihumibacter petaseus]|uniref:Putative Xre family transcriptional regulator n=1 Tax=Flavihumibacter petaseus NBRC 106054 TaxID=1220578 RepID=A0A0E9N4J7_9BACT|nr:helix-turn-helix transcriptional regulator [Flavihumibacter petaseus]GAO44723.1 putative Xre family transcriptional regulator [Flavihumibacter petaseus NBRC 106054]
MELSRKIAQIRKQKGLTQEQLADRANLTVRTIQRIESGASAPRAFTLKTLATALEVNFDELIDPAPADNQIQTDPDKDIDFLKTLCLSCFSYLIIPFIHFLIPLALLHKTGNLNREITAFARKIIRQQIFWKVITCLTLLLTLAYNLLSAYYIGKGYQVHYLWPFFIMYFLNGFLILQRWRQINGMRPDLQRLA